MKRGNNIQPSDDDNHNPPTTRNDNSLIHLPKGIPKRNNPIFTEDDNPTLRRQRGGGGSPKTMNKKGLSQVIISLLLVGLALVITGILWAVIHNLAVKGTEDINLYNLKSDFAVTLFEYDDDKEEWKIRIENRGEEIEGVEETGFRFVFHSEGESWDDIKIEKGLKPGAKSTFRFSQENLTGGDGIISEVKVYPIIKKEGDKRERELNRYFKQKPDVKDQLKSLGAIAWWRFEGNARDEIGENDGILKNGVNCHADGKYGRACNFDGTDDFIEIENSDELNPNQAISLAAWVKSDSSTGYQDYYGFIMKESVYRFGGPNWNNTPPSDSRRPLLDFRVFNSSGDNVIVSEPIPRPQDWHLLVGTYDSSEEKMEFYDDGSILKKRHGSNLFHTGQINSNTNPVFIGKGRHAYNFAGLIDEVMIFDRALTKKEIEYLYEWDFGRVG